MENKETILRSSNLKELQLLTREYHSAHAAFMEAVEKSDKDAMTSHIEKIGSLEKSIMDNLRLTVEACAFGNKFILWTRGETKSVKLTPVENGGLIKFNMEYVSRSNGTQFDTLAEAEAQVSPVNYAAFRSYINGIGKA